jgi:hypothetical protein
MCFGAMQASKANTKITKKFSVLCTLKMVDHYIDEMADYYSYQWWKLLSNLILFLCRLWGCCYLQHYAHDQSLEHATRYVCEVQQPATKCGVCAGFDKG